MEKETDFSTYTGSFKILFNTQKYLKLGNVHLDVLDRECVIENAKRFLTDTYRYLKTNTKVLDPVSKHTGSRTRDRDRDLWNISYDVRIYHFLESLPFSGNLAWILPSQ